MDFIIPVGKRSYDFDRKLYKCVFKPCKLHSAVEMYVFSSDFWVLSLGSVTRKPFVQMFRIVYFSFNNFFLIT